ncbi:MAG TPA: nucleoside-diphosphate kinase [Patescibacteria group bacterium]|nr:nucleoside-diphosphate kinase [Patescibacteria group bacterium]
MKDLSIHRYKTLVLIKPDGVERGLVGEILKRFENRGLKICGMKMLAPSRKLAEAHYYDVVVRHGKVIAEGLIKYLSEGVVIAIVLEGVEAIKVVRAMCGTTYPNESAPGTIRGDYCHISKDYANNNTLTVRNIIHASADEKDAKRELKLWFKPNELVKYSRVDEIHIW